MELAQLIADVTGAEVDSSTLLSDASISSLDRIQLAIRIEEEFGVRVDESVYEQYPTVGELAEYVREA